MSRKSGKEEKGMSSKRGQKEVEEGKGRSKRKGKK